MSIISSQILEQCEVDAIENVVDNCDLGHSHDDLVLYDETSVVVGCSSNAMVLHIRNHP